MVIFIPRLGGSLGIYLTHRGDFPVWEFRTYADDNTYTTKTVSNSYTPNGWHFLALRWSLDRADLFIDGVLRGTISNPKLPSGFYDIAYVGSQGHINTLIDDLRISSIARTDEEIKAYYKSMKPFFDTRNLVKTDILYNNVKITQSGGIEVYDNLNKQRVQLGNYTTGKYGLLLKDTTGNVTMISEDGVLQTWQEGRADNVASGKPLILNVYLPSNTKSVYQAILRFRRQSFRAYSTGAASGGGQTSGSSSQSTTSSGGDHRHKVMSYEGDITESTYGNTTPRRFIIRDYQGRDGAMFYIRSPHGYTTEMYTLGASGDHSHGMAHTHSISNHTHDITYGIYEGTLPTNITIKINGTNRTSVLGGGTGFNSDQSNLNITSYLSIGQWNTIELGSSQLGRLDATVFIQALMGV